MDGLTDPTLPLAVQLERALQNLRNHIRSSVELRKEADTLRESTRELKAENRKLNMQLMASDRMTVQLQVRTKAIYRYCILQCQCLFAFGQ